MWLKVVAVTDAAVTRDGQIRAKGRPFDHARLGPLEDWLDAHAGPGVIDGIAGRAVLDERHVKGKYRRLLPARFMIRAIVPWILMPEACMSDVVIALAADLSLLPWSQAWNPASGQACLDQRKGVGPGSLKELQATVLAAAADEHAGRPGQSLTFGKERPVAACSADGSVLRVPDTPANRAAFGTYRDGASWPSVRLFPLSNCLIRSMVAMTWGPGGTDKTASE